MKKSDILHQLSLHLDAERLIGENPGLDREAVSAVLEEASALVGPAELKSREENTRPPHGHGGMIKIYTDGASRGNPGEAGAGVVLTDGSGKVIRKLARYLGRTTNNQAEYAALITGLKAAAEAGADELHVMADSELLIRQMTGVYKVKNPGIKDRYDDAQKLLKHFRHVVFEHIPREKNSAADALANEAIDRRKTGTF